ncbi:MAG: tetratricopeptide repeat protein [Bacteroidia bacterium]|nr:tetratricopeptide repeat protein [Bacteroidia bacterium]
MKHLLPLLLCILYFPLTAQQPEQVLRTDIAKAESDTQRVHLLCKLSDLYTHSQPDSALAVAERALQLAEQTGDLRSLTNAYHFKGLALDYLNDMKGALQHYLKARDLAIQLGDKLLAAREYNGIGNIYIGMGKYTEANEALVRSLKIFEDVKSDQRFLPLVNLGNIYYYQKNLSKAVEYWEQAVPLLKQINNNYYLGILLANLAVGLENTGKYRESQRYLWDAIGIHSKLGDSIGLAVAYTNLSTCYLKLGMKDSALYFIRKGISICEKTGNMKELGGFYNNLADILADDGRHDEAMKYYRISMHLHDSLNIPDAKLYNLKGMARVYGLKGDFKNAYSYMSRYAELRDTLITKESQSLVEEMNAKYENDKKELEIERLANQKLLDDEKLAKERYFRIFLIVIIVLVVGMAVVALRGFLRKRKDNQELARQKKEIELAKMIIEEKNKDITDSILYARRIQQGLMPSEKMVERMLNRSGKKT